MSLLNCKECNSEVSTKAKLCPKCGAKAPKESLSPLKLVLITFAVIFWAVIIYGCVNAPDTSTPEEKAAKNIEEAIRYASYDCGYSIKETLNDPESAKFYYDNVKASAGKNGWIIQLPIRAKNGFNATIPAVYQCEERKINGKWRTIRMVRVY